MARSRRPGVVGDMIFILIAIYGLSILASLLGDHFVLIQYLGGAYLIGLGIVLWASKPKAEGAKQSSAISSSFVTGFAHHLGRPEGDPFLSRVLARVRKPVGALSDRHRDHSGHRDVCRRRTEAFVRVPGRTSRDDVQKIKGGESDQRFRREHHGWCRRVSLGKGLGGLIIVRPYKGKL